MTLSDVEQLAISMANAYRNDADENSEDVHRLAEFVCLAMPVLGGGGQPSFSQARHERILYQLGRDERHKPRHRGSGRRHAGGD